MASYDEIDMEIAEVDPYEIFDDILEEDPTQDDLNNKDIDQEMQDYGADEMVDEYLEQDDSML